MKDHTETKAIKTMKKLVLSFCCLVMLVTAARADYSYLTFVTTDGTETSLAASGLKITFSDGQAVVTTAEGTTTFTLVDLSEMYFSDVISSVTGVNTAADAEIESVYDMSGRLVASGLEGLGRGVYIVKYKGGETAKMLVK